jgi:hypothetical protein
MAVVGVLFTGLAVAAWNHPSWWAAAAVNLIAAADSLLRQHRPATATA